MRWYRIDKFVYVDVTPPTPTASYYRRVILPKLEFVGCLAQVTGLFTFLFLLAYALKP
jgi:hypothetical protein